MNATPSSIPGKRRLGFRTLMAEVRESMAMALDSILAHKLRSCLTLLGILVGVFSIIVVMTAIRVLQSNVEKELSGLGANTFAVSRFPAIMVDDSGADYEKYYRRKRFMMNDAELLKTRSKLALNVGVRDQLMMGVAISRYQRTNPNVVLQGVSVETFQTRNWSVEEGRAFSEPDIDGARMVCVLGNSLSKRLFPYGSAIGEVVKFDGIGYQVVGVLESKGSMFGQNQDNFISIPVTTGLNRFGRNHSVNIQIQARSREDFDDTVEEIRSILRAARKVPPGQPDDFEITSNDSLVAQFRSFTLAIRAGAAVISSIALLAAGVGIMNIMLVSVTERTREIGIRRAIGAKKRNIMIQFVLEAVALCQFGGILGVILGVGAGNLAALFFQVPPIIPVDWVIIGLLICSAVGVTFGTYPAYKAANLDPIESLRYE